MFAFAENHTKKNWYSRLSVRSLSGIGAILRITQKPAHCIHIPHSQYTSQRGQFLSGRRLSAHPFTSRPHRASWAVTALNALPIRVFASRTAVSASLTSTVVPSSYP